MKGKLIVIDGTDGVGKETQARRLITRLEQEKHAVKRIDFPRYDQPSSIGVREYLAGNLGEWEQVGAKTASLFFAMDRYRAREEMIRNLEHGMILVCNRYVSANMGHQGCKIDDPEERKTFFEWLYHLEFKELDIPKPDLSLIIYCPTQITRELRKKRGRAQDIHEADEAHQEKSARVFEEIATTFPGFVLVKSSTRDGQLKSVEKIHQIIWSHAKKIL